jgi:carbonic anhydrase
MRVLFGAAPLVALSLACSAAAVAEELAPVSPHGPAAAAGTPAPVASHGAHWSYGAVDGPDRWADLSPSYALCRQGRQQSPIDLGEPGEAGLAGLDLRYRPAALRVVNNGHTIQVNFPPGSHLKTGLREYELLQLHFHAPSEHTLNGRAFPLEVHLVHKDVQGRLGVLGILVEEGEANLALGEIWRRMPEPADGEHALNDVVINARDLLPDDLSYFRYMGSLTTPPCSEGVNWYVLRQPIQASAEQVRQFVAAVGQNARPVQKAHERLVVESGLTRPTGDSLN